MNQTTENAKAELQRAVDRLKKGLETTPDDRMSWSPSTSSRSAVEMVEHCTGAIGAMHGLYTGSPFPVGSTEELDKLFRAREDNSKSKGEVVADLDAAVEKYSAWLDGLSDSDLERMIKFPFGNFEVPLSMAITFPADHTSGHASQLEYIQTIYGDRIWH